MTELPIKPAFDGNDLAIVLQSSDSYAAYVAVTIQSIIEHSSSNHYYDIIVKTLDMTDENADTISQLADGKDNISVRVISLNELYNKYFSDEHIIGDRRFGGMSVTKMLLPELLQDYGRALHVDGDMIILEDISSMFGLDLGDNYAAAAHELFAEYLYNDDGYLKNAIDTFLELGTPRDYYSAAFMLLDLDKLREDFTIQQWVDFIIEHKCEFFEQDAFNYFFRGRFLRLGYEWNYSIDSRKYLANGNKKNPSPLYEQYLATKPYRKVIHFFTTLKPWGNVSLPESVKWWDVALRTPFYHKLIDSHDKIKTETRNSNRIFFVCETVYQLINILNIKHHMYPDVKSDIGFTASTDFSRYIEPLKASGLFENIYTSDYRVQAHMPIFRESAPNKELLKKPSHYKYAFALSQQYTDYFMAVSSSPFQVLTYYQIVQNGTVPRIHIFEDGSDTYITNIRNVLQNDSFDHTIYKPKEQMLTNINELMFYEPELYSGGDRYNLSVLPKINKKDKSFVMLLINVFGKCDMPKERYIYFNECFSTDNIPTNDIQLLDLIGNAVGKENVTVKMHPRSTKASEKLYRLHGYSFFAESTVPWEMFVLLANMSGKVLVSVSSNTLINPYVVFNKPVYAIYLMDIMKLSRRAAVRNPSYRFYFAKTLDLLNGTEKRVFRPSSLEHLFTILDYLEGVL